VLCVGEFGLGLGSECVCCVWESLEWLWRSECAVSSMVVGVCMCVCVSALCL
jgi:hypothetical protein